MRFLSFLLGQGFALLDHYPLWWGRRGRETLEHLASSFSLRHPARQGHGKHSVVMGSLPRSVRVVRGQRIDLHAIVEELFHQQGRFW